MTWYTVTDIAGQLYRGARLGGKYVVSFQQWIFYFRVVIEELHLAVGDLTELLTNGKPLWEAYYVLMGRRMVMLDKYSGVRTVGVGETWCQFIAKCILHVAGQEAKVA